MDDLFGTGGNEMEQRVLTRPGKDSQDRIRWTQDSQNGPFIEVNQNKATDELEEIPVAIVLFQCTQCT